MNRRWILPILLCTSFVLPAGAADPASVQNLLKTGREQERKGDCRSALQIYLEANALAPGQAQVQQALRRASRKVSRQSGREREKTRREYVRTALKFKELNRSKWEGFMARYLEGRKLLKKGKVLQASDIFNSIIDEYPGFELAHRGVFNSQKILGRQLRRGKFVSPQHFAAVEGVYQYNQTHWQQAALSLESAINSGALPPDLSDARIGDYAAAARKKADRAAWLAERQTLFDEARRNFDVGKLQEAHAGFDSILKRDPADLEARGYLGRTKNMMAGISETVQEEARRKEIAERMTSGTLLSIQGRPSEAMDEFLRVLELDPGNREAKDQLADVRKTLKKQGVYIPTVMTEENDAEKKYKEGLKLYGNERYPEAKTAFEEALKINPNHTEARQALERLQNKSEQ